MLLRSCPCTAYHISSPETDSSNAYFRMLKSVFMQRQNGQTGHSRISVRKCLYGCRYETTLDYPVVLVGEDDGRLVGAGVGKVNQGVGDDDNDVAYGHAAGGRAVQA
jgi:hypothetical protein